MTIAGASAALTRETTAREVRVEIASSYEAFLNLEPAWSELVEAAGIDHPFLEHCWVRTWWECFGADSELHILVVKEGDAIIAIAPLISTRFRMYGIPARRLGFFYNSHVPRADFLIARRPAEAYKAIWDHLTMHRDSWDLIQLCQLPEDSMTFQESMRSASEAGFPTGVWPSGESPFVMLDTSWSEYYESLAAKHRSNLRNRLKRLSQAGTVELETITRPGTLTEAVNAGFRLEESAWKQEAGTAISCDERVRRFYEIFARRAAERNWLRLNFLDANSQRIAFDYSLAYGDQIFLLKLGYDPDFAPYSPSNLLLSMTLKSAFEEGLAKYDFLGETAPWKTRWTKTSRPSVWLYVFSRSLKGRCLHFLKFQFLPWAKTVMARRKKEVEA